MQAQRKENSFIKTSLSEQRIRHGILEKINGRATRNKLTLSNLMPLPINFLRNSTIYFYICSYSERIYLWSRFRRYAGHNLEIFRFPSLIR